MTSILYNKGTTKQRKIPTWKKNDILQRAQASKHDEGMQYFHQKAKAIAGVIFTASALLLMICNIIYGRKATEILMLYWIYLGSTCLIEYHHGKSKMNLAIGIFSLIALAGVSVTYVRSIFL